jgi:ubiquitin C-terminal hydrolase
MGNGQEVGEQSHAEAAAEAWQGHLKRNRSVVVDTFYGQYRNIMTCPVDGCGRVSTTFDPFNVLTLPLPSQSVRNMKVCALPTP